jgi:Fungal specific transcription factor domain
VAFKRRAQETHRGSVGFNVDAMLAVQPSNHVCSQMCTSTPALMLSDRLVNTFFQEFAPLFPILHRPSFLGIYNEYIVSPSSITDKNALAMVNFAFAIASLSKHVRSLIH